MSRTKVGVLISGRGSNLKALLEAARDPAYPAEIAVVVSNRADAGGLAVAAEYGVEPLVVDHRPFGPDREAHERAMHAALVERGVEFVALAGYMRVLTPWFVGAWSGRMLNVHPSLLPAFPGLDTHRRALDAGVKIHGCTVHLVSEGVDEGPILGQAAVPVLPGDGVESLAARVLEAEHQLYPACLAALTGQASGSEATPAALFSY
ncbi:phosphoribosylglycinamide formyltransferase [Caulobacter sp. 17J65-9]|uniref:phosphoribosylglycinamide formyltransferase n=1 Tax=Caulobacter sp. 17J65-9 TaxID=2709382 RepID=UPI0013C567B0|nr:phosphoribosylglycinamide formyltransferase [Caulobacter sp. 17J65-9]NEX91330.1 phosphoribosylglycinamide formyltransferase [Caulobacter sp. 17J65-9]